jgi:hypothetical protein
MKATQKLSVMGHIQVGKSNQEESVGLALGQLIIRGQVHLAKSGSYFDNNLSIMYFAIVHGPW